jgi:hypothetical protein
VHFVANWSDYSSRAPTRTGRYHAHHASHVSSDLFAVTVVKRDIRLRSPEQLAHAVARPPSPSSTIVVVQSAPAAQLRKRSRVPSWDPLSTTTISFDISETELIDIAMESRRDFNASRRFLVQTMMLKSTRLPTEAWPSAAWRDNARGASKFPQKPVEIAQFADPRCEN